MDVMGLRLASVQRLMIVLLLAGLALAAAPAFAQPPVAPTATVNTGSLNVRSGPGVEFGSLFTLPRGYGVMLLARNAQANWVLIMLADGTRGWVNINYLYTTYRVSQLPIDETAPASPVTPTARNGSFITINVRQSPDMTAAVAGGVPAGATVTLIGRNFSSTWVKVRLADGVEGWAFAQNLVTSVPVRSLAPADGSVVGPQLPAPGAPASPSPSRPTTGVSGRGQYYTIARGDTLSAIARRFGVNLYTLAAANGIYNLDLIYAGRRLFIP
jgi:uncharacterized protein YraI